MPAGLKTARTSPGPVAGGRRDDLSGLAGGQIPERDRVVARDGGELAAAGVPGHRTDDVRMRTTVVMS